MAYIIAFLWGVRSAKSELFWLYLMQLKEYRLMRLADHFRTEKGKRLLFDKLNISKIALLLLASNEIVISYLPLILLVLYAIESSAALKSIYVKKIKKPIITQKSGILMAIAVSAELLFGLLVLNYAANLYYVSFFLLLFDILIPAIIITIVLSLKPLNYFLKKKVLDAAKQKRKSLKNLLVIGITGSYGKTSTKEFLYEILKKKFKCVKTPEHVNAEIGIANFMLNNLTQKDEIFICEMGAYCKGDIKTICDIVRPKIGIFLGANEQHLSLFGSMENLLEGEGGKELLSALPEKGLGIFNGNNIYSYELWKNAKIPKRITYVPNLTEIINPEKRDVRTENIRVFKDRISFKVLTSKNSKGVEFKANLLGAHNIENILLAVVVGEELGLTLQEVAEEVQKIEPLQGTMSLSVNKAGGDTFVSPHS